MIDKKKRTLISGGVLIGLGLVLFLVQFIEGFDFQAIPLLIGGLLLAAYFYRRAYGLLVSGCILLGMSIGSMAEETSLRYVDASSIGLGLGFLAIYIIQKAYRGRSHWWPLIPGFLLIADGLASAIEGLEDWLSVGWPLLLVLIGILLITGRLGPAKN